MRKLALLILFLLDSSQAMPPLGPELADCPHKHALLTPLPWRHPRPDPRSVAELLAAAVAEVPVPDESNPHQSQRAWQEKIAPLYHALEAKYETAEGRREMDEIFAKEMANWRDTNGYPPGLVSESWKPESAPWDSADKSKLVSWYFTQVPFKPNDSTCTQVTRTYLNHTIGWSEAIAGGSNTAKMRARLAESIVPAMVVRIVTAYHYEHRPDSLHFP